MDKRFWAILGVIAVIVIGAIWISNDKKAGAPSSNSSPTNHVEGSTSTGVKLVEYGDYQCPYCGQYYPIVKQVAAEYSSQITFQFRNLPLTQVHQNAFAAARAAEAAALQNKFWEMHDMLYENQSAWVPSSNPAATFDSYAQQLGLNVTKFKTDYASQKINNLITADLDAFNKTGAPESTPTFFLDGKQVQPSESVASFESLINTAIREKGFTPKPTQASTGTTAPTSSSSNSSPQSTQ